MGHNPFRVPAQARSIHPFVPTVSETRTTWLVTAASSGNPHPVARWRSPLASATAYAGCKAAAGRRGHRPGHPLLPESLLRQLRPVHPRRARRPARSGANAARPAPAGRDPAARHTDHRFPHRRARPAVPGRRRSRHRAPHGAHPPGFPPCSCMGRSRRGSTSGFLYRASTGRAVSYRVARRAPPVNHSARTAAWLCSTSLVAVSSVSLS